MPKTSNDFYAEGRADAQRHKEGALLLPPSQHKRESKSWQAVAYFRGWEDATKEVQMKKEKEKAPVTIGVDLGGPGGSVSSIAAVDTASGRIVAIHRTDEFFIGWPKAAREHMKRLALDLADETREKRRSRLLKAVARLTKRHGARAAKAMSFPISTQPHPDGPITAGMLLHRTGKGGPITAGC